MEHEKETCIEKIDMCGYYRNDRRKIMASLKGKKVSSLSLANCALDMEDAMLLAEISVVNLNLSGHSALRADVMEVVFGLEGLCVLDLSYRDCKHMFDQVVNRVTLQGLALAYCKNIDDSMMRRVEVRKLNLNGCKDVTDEGLAHLVGIEELNLSFCGDGIRGDTLEIICGTLRVLNVYGCRKFKLENLVGLENLEELEMYCWNAEDVSFIERMKHNVLSSLVLKLEFPGCCEVVVSLDNVKNLSNLQKLKIKDCKVQLHGLGCLRELIVMNNILKILC